MKPKPPVVLFLILLLTITTQARHKAVATKPECKPVAGKKLNQPVGYDLSPVHFLVLDI